MIIHKFEERPENVALTKRHFHQLAAELRKQHAEHVGCADDYGSEADWERLAKDCLHDLGPKRQRDEHWLFPKLLSLGLVRHPDEVQRIFHLDPKDENRLHCQRLAEHIRKFRRDHGFDP